MRGLPALIEFVELFGRIGISCVAMAVSAHEVLDDLSRLFRRMGAQLGRSIGLLGSKGRAEALGALVPALEDNSSSLDP